MGNNDNLFESLFKSNGVANDTVDFLTELTKEHPYFTAAQFYLLQQTKPDSSAYTKQAAKTAILFNNPLWLNFQLNEFSSTDALLEHPIILSNELSEGSINNEAPISASEIETENEIEIIEVEKEGVLLIAEQQAMPIIEVKKEEQPLIEEQPIIPLIEEKIEEQPLIAEHSVAEEINSEELINEEANIEKVNIEEIFIENRSTDEAVKEEANTKAPTENIGTNEIAAEDIHTGEIIPEEKITEIEPATAEEKLIPAELTLNGFHNKEAFKEDERLENDEYNEEDEEEELRNGREIEPMHIKLNFTPDMPTTEETISFEPLHTSDYFAALGIKFSEENKTNDKLGRQLKSFTEWLKTMKKIHADQLPQQSEQTDLQIQKMAEKSNAEGETLTEAMAEVLFQQGKAKKAVEVYQKLSLLNPSKSAYFAAKIGQIER